MGIDWQALATPFAADEIEWRVGQKSRDGKKATLLAYLTSRAVQQRLDEVLGPDGWQASFTPIDFGTRTVRDKSGKETQEKLSGFLCTLALRTSDGWVSKADIADITDIEALKGGVSGALKRAAVLWGIGRYLYGLDSRYLPIVEGWAPNGSNGVYCPVGDGPGHIIPPALPDWALPPRKPSSRTERKADPAPDTDAPTDPKVDAHTLVAKALVDQGWARTSVVEALRDFWLWNGRTGDPWTIAPDRLAKLPAWVASVAEDVTAWRSWWAEIDKLLEAAGASRPDLTAFLAALEPARPAPATMPQVDRNKLLAYLTDGGGLDRLRESCRRSA